MTQLVLSLFPGIGMFDTAFELEGFCVVRGPDVLWGGDIRRFHPPEGRFDGIIGGPPCQEFSSLAHMVRHNGYKPRFGNLIPEFSRCVSESQPEWFLMENVPKAPAPVIDNYGVHEIVINSRQFGSDQNRLRKFWFGKRGEREVLLIDTVALESQTILYCNGETASDRTTSRLPRNNKGIKGFKESKKAQGLADDFDLPGFTVAEKCRAVRNGVPIVMGRAIAKAIMKATNRLNREA